MIPKCETTRVAESGAEEEGEGEEEIEAQIGDRISRGKGEAEEEEEDDKGYNTTTICKFYSLSHRHEFPISIPFRWIRCLNPFDGWLILIDPLCNPHMLNPLTGAHIPLPPVHTFPGIAALPDGTGYTREEDGKLIECSPKQLCEFLFMKAVIAWTSPSAYTVMLIWGNWECSLAYAGSGDAAWTEVELKLETPGSWFYSFEDLLYYRGRFHALDSNGRVQVCDLSGPAPVTTRITNEFKYVKGYKRYLVELDGHLHQVLRDVDFNGPLYRTEGFEVHKLVNYGERGSQGVNEWVPVKSLGSHSLFLGDNNSLALSTCHTGGVLKRNCIYFTDDCYESFLYDPQLRHDVGVFDLEDGSIKSYYPDESQLSWPHPLWFLPNLSKQGVTTV